MIVNLYTVKDELSEFSTLVMPLMEDAHAKRWFRNYVSENSMMKQNPEDFSCWKIGSYDTKEGKVIEIPFPELIERAKGEQSGN